MRISKDQIPAKINVPGAVARVASDFGDATGFGKMGGEYFSLGAGTDIERTRHRGDPRSHRAGC